MTNTRYQREGRTPQTSTVVTRMSRPDCTEIQLRTNTQTSEIRPDTMKKDKTATYLITRSQTKAQHLSLGQNVVSKLVKTDEQKSDYTIVKEATKSNPRNAHKKTAEFVEKKTIQENELNSSKKAKCLPGDEMKPKFVQDTNVFKEKILPDTVKEPSVTSGHQGNDYETDKLNSVQQTPRPTRGLKHDYAKLAGIKRRILPSPELPRFARKARRLRKPALKGAKDADTESERLDASCEQPKVESEKLESREVQPSPNEPQATDKEVTTEVQPSPNEPQATGKEVTTPSLKRKFDKEGKLTTEKRRKIVKNPLLERDSQQKARRRLLRNRSSSKSVTESPEANEEVVIGKPCENKNQTSCEFDYYVNEAQTSPEFVKYFHETRRPPKPDPDVYDWPKEWLPKPDTELVSANTSALEIDPPAIKPSRHVFEDTFYLQSPPKMRSEMEPWKLKFDYNPEVEKARTKKIRETESQLLSESKSGRRRTKTEKLAIKRKAKEMVDTEEYIEKTARYNDRKERNMEIMRDVYKERGLGEPLDTDDIAKMAMDIKHKVYLKSMKIAHPDHILVGEEETNNGNGNIDFGVPEVDTISNEARKATGEVLKESETEVERNMGVAFHEAETRPALGVNYIYESYKMEKNRVLDHPYSNNHGLDSNGVGGYNVDIKPQNDPTKRMTLWYGHEKHRKLEQYKKQKYSEPMAHCSGSNGYGSSYNAIESQYLRSTILDGQARYENDAVVTESQYSEGEKFDDEGSDNEVEEEEIEEEAVSQPRMTLWYGHIQSIGDDEDEAIKMMCGGRQTMKFDNTGDDEEMEVELYDTKYCGHDEVMEYGEDESISRGNKRKYGEIEDDDEMVDVEDEGDEEQTFVRTVPFLQLTTEDIPLRVQTKAYKFKRVSRDADSPDDTIDR